ncbi:gamma-glutamylcyclotransferase [Peribacillus asahii]|uniref:Gamma-glutamylcyclotransferase n=1 Tax=Peribacillus asahii TaxID=228899 RepID=A0A398B6W2_9BACI|nr:gamma-glutamylcyclotransferase family protein [Peribacillus asahii]RID85291.1 gamma-glutamylcyclotransferase [Peribacillus asahii]
MNHPLFRVFVYGTLLTGESNHHVAKPYIKQMKQGKVRGWLYNVGAYPALVLDSEAEEIIGEWFSVTEEGLKRMDWLEGYEENRIHNDYERVWVKDVSGDIEGFVYVYSIEKVEGLEKIECNSWREFKGK